MTRGPIRAAGPRSIRFRIAAAFLAAVAVLAGSVAYLVVEQRQVAWSLDLVAQVYYPLAARVGHIKLAQDRVQRDLARINRDRPRPVTGETSAAEIYAAEAREELELARLFAVESRELQKVLGEAEEAAHLAVVKSHIDTVDALLTEYQAEASTYLGLVDAGRVEDAKEHLRGPIRVKGNALEGGVAQLEDVLGARIEGLTRESRERVAATAAVAIVLAGASSLVSAGLLGAVLYALRPIQRLTEQVQRLAGGDYSGRVQVGGADEVGVLAAEFNAMAQAIEQRDSSLQERAHELRLLSRYLGSVLDSLEDGLVVVEAGVVRLANPAAARTWAATPEAPPPAGLSAALASPGRHDLEVGGRRYAVRTVPFGDHGVVAGISDVTEEVRAQEALARSERLALVGQMLAQITHEVRNPLNALSLNAELLGDEIAALDPERRTEAWELLEMIAREVDRLTQVTGHYLQLARRPLARLVPEDLRQVLTEVARLLEPELTAAGVALTLDLAELPPQLVDANQLRQALLNVVRNAVEAGGRHLTLVLRADAGQTTVTLSDDGQGMTAAQLTRAFDPFYSTKDTGTGLGLAITRQILEDHGGSVRVDAAPGRGTTLALVLPARPTDAPPVDPADAEEVL